MCTERVCGGSKRLFPVLFGLMALVLITFTGCASTMYRSPGDIEAEMDDVQYLSSYGEWVQIQPFGMAWRPYVVSEWAPYYYGHWIWTDAGWTWTSYEPYGWLVFHYGFWGYQPGFGWFWVPGDTWYPANVQWYTFGSYTAWAPVPPHGVVWPDPWDPYDVDVWIVINVSDFTREDIGRHRIARTVYRDVAHRQTVVKRAPEVRRVESLTRKKVPVVEVRKTPVGIRTRSTSTVTRSVRERGTDSSDRSVDRDATKLKRIVLPEAETRRIEKRAKQVEREVITRDRRTTTQREKSRDTRSTVNETREKKSQDGTSRSTKSREKKSDSTKRKTK